MDYGQSLKEYCSLFFSLDNISRYITNKLVQSHAIRANRPVHPITLKRTGTTNKVRLLREAEKKDLKAIKEAGSPIKGISNS